ncbi:hypothetical protein [Neoroseomonas lacus]|uniref:Uncharacterized protein n=1 Tax=Neoroseomonas lacus TaxID=287609 RepID=A0A917KQG3_9PROT|nr:hypothetical protein [Neoroseomonas lacus]GGJ21979.1 hypothetical protein GCM10011320_31510 [Neoroseomonas lacus]
MTGRMDRGATPQHGRGRGPANQARPLVLAALLITAGCTAGQGGEALGPLWDHLTGPAFEGRDTPPGVDAPPPNLGTVPARPTVPDLAVRDALTAALAEERQRSRNPLDAEMRPVAPRPSGTEGNASMPLQAPGPPPLAAAPRVSWDPVDVAPAAPATVPVPRGVPAARPAPAAQPTPAAPPAVLQPAAPQPAAPTIGGGPPPPPPAELLAPTGPPPLPSSDLLAPRSR